MINKLDIIKDSENCVDAFGYTHNVAINKINELVDAVNSLQLAKDAMFFAIRNIQNRITALDNPTYHEAESADNSEKANCQENVQQISYIAPGDITVFYGAGCSVEFDTPLPKGTRITIKSITKGV